MRISSNFDSGNIEVVSLESAKDIQLNIKKDKDSDFYQWFHFKLETSAGEEHQFSILNAKAADYHEGWDLTGYFTPSEENSSRSINTRGIYATLIAAAAFAVIL